MNRMPSSPSRLRRVSLLLAALLHLFGAAALPVLHAAAEQPAAHEVLEREKQGSPVPPHDEQHCVVCHGMGSLALPEPASAIVLAGERRQAARPEHRSAAPLRLVPTLRARAPPALA